MHYTKERKNVHGSKAMYILQMRSEAIKPK